MKALVLGGCGFIGSHVVDALAAQGFSVTVLDRQPERYRDPLPSVRYEFGDFADKMTLLEALAGQDVVFHLVSTTFPSTADIDPKADVTGNLLSTLGLLEAMSSLGIRRLVYLSSGGTVYGPPETTPITEGHPLRPIGSYGIVKVAIENYIRFYAANHDLSPVIIRAANPFGPRQGHIGVQGVISTFFRKITSGEPIEIWGDGEVIRDYLYVADLADLCVKAASSDVEGTFNAGSGVGRSLKQVISSISNVTKREIKPIFKPARPADVPVSILDSTYAEKSLKWRASTDFNLALSETWDYINIMV